MAKQDTIVGLTGAAILASVMVGVFLYEYNNVDDGDPDRAGQTGRLAEFRAQYPTIDPTADIDGDGTPNWEDHDMDGDGLNDTEDPLIGFEFPFSDEGSPIPVGSSSPTMPASCNDSEPLVNCRILNFNVPPNATYLMAQLQYTATSVRPASTPGLASAELVLLGPDGSERLRKDSSGNWDPTTGSIRGTITLPNSHDTTPGMYQLQVILHQGAQMTFDGTFVVAY